MTDSANPFTARVVDIQMTKFNGGDPMGIMPQVMELNIYQSVFSPIIKAELVINDLINILGNYPISNEEYITITLDQDSGIEPNERQKFELKFVIVSVEKIVVDDAGRSMAYVMQLDSVEAFVNAKTKISKAYKDTIEKMIESIVTEYLKSDKKLNILADTKKSRDLVVPLLRPFAALNWMCKFAVSAESEKHYTHMFFESMAAGDGFEGGSMKPGFVFKALQRPSFRGALDEAAINSAAVQPYFYISNIEAVRNSPAQMKSLMSRGFSEARSVLSVKLNKRYAGLEKIIGGYFENEYVEINMLQKDHKITKTSLRDSFNSLYVNKLNTQPYIDDVIDFDDRDETAPRTKYIINNYDDLNQPSLRDKWGRGTRSLFAYGQINLTISIPTDFLLRPGDLIYLNLPDVHGFQTIDDEKYISGLFTICEIKNTLRVNGDTVTVLKINKDSYLNSLFEKTLFAPDSASPAFGNPQVTA